MNKSMADIRAALHFIKEGFRSLDKTASLIPSSPLLVDAMLRFVPLERAHCVVELGPGTGTLTRAILKRLSPDGHLHSIEINEQMAASIAARITDPRLRSHHGNALEASALLCSTGCSRRADAVISSLGLAIMGEALRIGIVRSVLDILAPAGIFMQYSYVHTRFFVMSPQSLYYRVFNAERFLGRFFKNVERKLILLNVPPAFVYSCQRPQSA